MGDNSLMAHWQEDHGYVPTIEPQEESHMLGLPPVAPRLEPLLLEVLDECHRIGPFTKSNFARSHATPIAEAACRKWITVETAPGAFGNRWLITALGLHVLEAHKTTQSTNREKEANGV